MVICSVIKGKRIKISAKNGIVHVWDLTKSIYIDFEPHYRKKLLETLRELSPNKSWYSIGKMLYPTINPKKAFNSIVPFVKRNRKASFKLVKKICEFLTSYGYEEFSLENMERHINRIASDNPANEIVNPKLPFNFNSPNGSRFLSAIFHDGGITKKLNPFYVNFDSNMRRLIKNSAIKTFGDIEGRIEGKKQLTFPKIIGEILVYGLGLPSGRKIYFDPNIPEFITKADKKIRIAFIKQAFDDEGSIGKCHIRLQLAGISEPSKLLKDNKKLIESLDIHTTKIIKTQEYFTKNNGRHECYAFFITGRLNLLKYHQIINFNIAQKSNKLKILLDNYKQWQTGRNKALDYALENICKLELEGKIINSEELIKATCRSKSSVLWYLKELTKLGSIKIIKDSCPKAIGKGPTFREFKLTREGRKKLGLPIFPSTDERTFCF